MLRILPSRERVEEELLEVAWREGVSLGGGTLALPELVALLAPREPVDALAQRNLRGQFARCRPGAVSRRGGRAGFAAAALEAIAALKAGAVAPPRMSRLAERDQGLRSARLTAIARLYAAYQRAPRRAVNRRPERSPGVRRRTAFKGPSATIKSHHNVGGLPAAMKLRLVEALRELFKDEVRALGRELGLEASILNRQPLPGPGLATRILGEVTAARLSLLRRADAIVQDEVRKAGLYERLWQAFAVLLPVQSVGVMGDERPYENALALRAVESQDGMTADWARMPYEVLASISGRITNEVHGINRVVYDISSKPPATIEWE
jgi:hypothetical protein